MKLLKRKSKKITKLTKKEAELFVHRFISILINSQKTYSTQEVRS